MAELRPCFGPTAEIIRFTLGAPMDYVTEKVSVKVTDAGLEWADKELPANSSSSSDEDFVLTGNKN